MVSVSKRVRSGTEQRMGRSHQVDDLALGVREGMSEPNAYK
jgi:hypothetical protein